MQVQVPSPKSKSKVSYPKSKDLRKGTEANTIILLSIVKIWCNIRISLSKPILILTELKDLTLSTPSLVTFQVAHNTEYWI